ncbi:hypothetical protein NEOLEDRAFT_1184762 [Neolentinus lepideus HHB14362 ss-1]|uniref:Uncharacterized protein n=1 Tax=Neolentinus lepideus HHB14362 ss-1 TaxID=1314782 RepID=A0A165M6J4_9AGAM|nr:hypothetical protein NEOLEDRAFT_1184762 [Neolentinus lepideus HHB14362 ss-1]
MEGSRAEFLKPNERTQSESKSEKLSAKQKRSLERKELNVPSMMHYSLLSSQQMIGELGKLDGQAEEAKRKDESTRREDGAMRCEVELKREGVNEAFRRGAGLGLGAVMAARGAT